MGRCLKWVGGGVGGILQRVCVFGEGKESQLLLSSEYPMAG